MNYSFKLETDSFFPPYNPFFFSRLRFPHNETSEIEMVFFKLTYRGNRKMKQY